MELLFIRHALPLRSQPGEGSDAELSALGYEMAQRLPAVLGRHAVVRIVSSPQRRALQTAAPLAHTLGLDILIDDRFAEYDRDLPSYIPLEQLREEDPAQWSRISQGLLPDGVDEGAFRDRVRQAVGDLVASATRDDVVAVVSHGGVINAVLHDYLGTARLFAFPLDYASVTHLRISRSGVAGVVTVNGVEHVWDLLPSRRSVAGTASPVADAT